MKKLNVITEWDFCDVCGSTYNIEKLQEGSCDDCWLWGLDKACEFDHISLYFPI